MAQATLPPKKRAAATPRTMVHSGIVVPAGVVVPQAGGAPGGFYNVGASPL